MRAWFTMCLNKENKRASFPDAHFATIRTKQAQIFQRRLWRRLAADLLLCRHGGAFLDGGGGNLFGLEPGARTFQHGGAGGIGSPHHPRQGPSLSPMGHPTWRRLCPRLGSDPAKSVFETHSGTRHSNAVGKNADACQSRLYVAPGRSRFTERSTASPVVSPASTH